jgi:hypothetical protein
MLIAPLLLVVLAQPPADLPSVTLDFVLTSSKGEAPADLTPAEVTVKIGGKVRPLLSLESIDTRAAGRDIILIVEEATLYALEKVAIDAIHKAVDSLQPRDRITYASTRGGKATVEPGADVTKTKASAMTTGPGELFTCLSDLLTNIEIFTKRLPRGRTSFLAVIARGHPEGAASNPDDGGRLHAAARGAAPDREAHLGRTDQSAPVHGRSHEPFVGTRYDGLQHRCRLVTPHLGELRRDRPRADGVAPRLPRNDRCRSLGRRGSAARGGQDQPSGCQGADVADARDTPR